MGSNFQYVSPANEKVVNGLYDPLGAEYLLVLSNVASARNADRIRVNGAPGSNNGMIAVETTFTLLQKDHGVVWSKTLFTYSTSTGVLVDHQIDPVLLPTLLVEAQSNLWKEIREEVAYGKRKISEVASQK